MIDSSLSELGWESVTNVMYTSVSLFAIVLQLTYNGVVC